MSLGSQLLEEALLGVAELEKSVGIDSPTAPVGGELKVLFLAPFATTSVAKEESAHWSRKLSKSLGYKVHIAVGDPTYSELDLECKGFWFRPHAKKLEDQVRKFRTQAFSAVVNLLGLAAKHRPQLILGVQQGGLVAALAGFPLLMETACRLRAVPQSELAEFRRGWAGRSGPAYRKPRRVAVYGAHDNTVRRGRLA